LGKVLSLQKTVINGYSSFNSIAITPDSQEVHLLDSFVYSNSQPNYVSQSDGALTEKKSGKPKELTNKKGKLISVEKQDLVSKGTYYNGSKLAKNQISKTSALLKKEDRMICHVLDKEFDDSTRFEHIENLGDEFVIRLKLNRLSNESKTVYTPKGKLSKQVKQKK
jgi:hypothetical protein